MKSKKNAESAEQLVCAFGVRLALQHNHCSVGRFAVTGFVDRDDAVFQFLAAGLVG